MDHKELLESRDNLPLSALGAKDLIPGNTLPSECRAVYVGGAGDLVATFATGEKVTLKALEKGVYPFALKSVDSAGTTASFLVALY